jgi:hypothetical protein
MYELSTKIFKEHKEYIEKIYHDIKSGIINGEYIKMAGCHNLCRIGAWLEAIEPFMSHNSDFQIIQYDHDLFHDHINDILELCLSGEKAVALDKIDDIMVTAGGELFHSVDALIRLEAVLPDELKKLFNNN